MAIESLSDELKNWYRVNCECGRLSWGVLSKKSGVTVSNITKIAKSRTAKPKYETARALLRAVLPDHEDDVDSYLAKEYEAESFTFSRIDQSRHKFLNQNTTDLFRDFLTYRLFKLSLSGRHHIDDLKSNFGADGVLPRIQLLAENGLAFVNGKGFLCRKRGSQHTRNCNTNTVAAEFKHVIDLVANKNLLAEKNGVDFDVRSNKMAYWHFAIRKDDVQGFNQDVSAFLDRLTNKYKTDSSSPDSVEMFLNLVTGRFDFE